MNSTKVQKQQRQFYCIMAGAAIALSILQFFKNRPEMARGFAIASVFFILIEFIIPAVGRKVFKLWMHFAHILGKINTTLLISLVFFAMITPIGLIRRLTRAKSIHGALACKKRQSSWFALQDNHRYSAPY